MDRQAEQALCAGRESWGEPLTRDSGRCAVVLAEPMSTQARHPAGRKGRTCGRAGTRGVASFREDQVPKVSAPRSYRFQGEWAHPGGRGKPKRLRERSCAVFCYPRPLIGAQLEKAGETEYVLRAFNRRNYREPLIVQKAIVLNLGAAVGKVELIE